MPRWPVFSNANPSSATTGHGHGTMRRSSQRNSSSLELPGRLKSTWTAVPSGWSFFYQKTLPDFIQAATKLDWSLAETFSEFENVLDSSYRTAWREVVKDHFNLSPDKNTGEEMQVEPENRAECEEGFHRAVKLFVCTIMDSETPWDVQYVYLARAGTIRSSKIL
jgi:hypothetical protein